MSDHFNGHIHREAFEKVLRETFGSICADQATAHPALACQARASECLIQFALFVAD